MSSYKDPNFSPSAKSTQTGIIKGHRSGLGRRVVLAPIYEFVETDSVESIPTLPSVSLDQPFSPPPPAVRHTLDLSAEKIKINSEIKAYRESLIAQVQSEVAQFRKDHSQKLQEEYQRQVDAGFADGSQKATETLKQELSFHAKTFMQTLSDLRAGSQTVLQSAKEDIFQLSVRAAERMISAQLTLEPALIRKIVDDALNRITEKNRVIIRINPADSTWLKDHREWLDHYSRDIKELIIQDDDKVAQGGCIIETKLGYIDSSIKSKLASIEKALQSAYEEDPSTPRPSSSPAPVVSAVTLPVPTVESLVLDEDADVYEVHDVHEDVPEDEDSEDYVLDDGEELLDDDESESDDDDFDLDDGLDEEDDTEDDSEDSDEDDEEKPEEDDEDFSFDGI